MAHKMKFFLGLALIIMTSSLCFSCDCECDPPVESQEKSQSVEKESKSY